MKFSSLDLAPPLLQAIEACGYSEMTPVQEKAIIPARRGRDVLANAQTGTGKTAAFALPILQQMLDKPLADGARRPRALILTPTRELAEQLAHTIGAYAQFLPFTITALYGGVKMGGQANKLKAGTDIIISTPGRLLEHIALGNVNLAGVEFTVLDEADRMLDMGFIADVQKLMQHTAKKRQTLLFSATTSAGVNELAHKLLKNHVDIRVTKVNTTADTVDHVMYPVEEARKLELFIELLDEQNWFQVLVFTSTKEQADQLMRVLKVNKVDAAVCHADKTQGSRRRALADFKSSKIQVLIATEVAARGLDIQGLDYVVNYNLPYLAEDYVHRIGRTGRAGNKGHAISFVSREEERIVDSIERMIGAKVKRIYREGFEVGNRDQLLKNIAKKGRANRTNKATRTRINRNKG
ncbi:DEAD/DEAH box helicase [Neptunomonas phycophila]|jgi:superfamily II DNA/RNA helicase|uniref:DEAD/DEAH box helicase n=2 Tax=Neptunomonas phycophila TaxID=1572645 RepID=A0ABT9EXF8_9GAMM|nr:MULTISPECIES: DEAD/DEAH box helicase [Neptunomonas]MDN2660461.1 DEAD/DEAH box helicase [Neptunomonas sp. CHC150]MDO6469558.1 DEAD/DEAH box helicase [Neptunomonas phycophila]MDP2523752.1 DEAD/DEAH box helicase [Neptunomonas phycophila]QLE97526.1 DEAD/DEAH box helicase [Neptunomonas phycophila]